MPMVARIASGSYTGTASIAAGAPTRLITTATVNPGFANTTLPNAPGMYAVYWSFIVTAGGSAGGSAQVPCFTWRDPDLNVGITSTGGAYGSFLNGAVTGTVWGASGSAGGGVTGVVSAHTRGFELFQAGSGASGASAYIQVSSVGTGGAFTRFDFQVFRVDDWGV